MTKRKVTYEQSLALDYGRHVARANQRDRVAARQADEAAAADRAAAAANHQHAWGNWDYVLGHTHEVRECRGCDYAELRPVRL